VIWNGGRHQRSIHSLRVIASGLYFTLSTLRKGAGWHYA
jgi:hypothetical protein